MSDINFPAACSDCGCDQCACGSMDNDDDSISIQQRASLAQLLLRCGQYLHAFNRNPILSASLHADVSFQQLLSELEDPDDSVQAVR